MAKKKVSLLSENGRRGDPPSSSSSCVNHKLTVEGGKSRNCHDRNPPFGMNRRDFLASQSHRRRNEQNGQSLLFRHEKIAVHDSLGPFRTLEACCIHALQTAMPPRSVIRNGAIETLGECGSHNTFNGTFIPIGVQFPNWS